MSSDRNTTQGRALRPVGDLMKALTKINPFALSLAIAVSITMAPATALPQDEGAEDVIEEIVTTGTRRQGQSPTETLSPIDVLGGDLIANQAAFDLTDGLTKIMPSIKRSASRSRTVPRLFARSACAICHRIRPWCS